MSVKDKNLSQELKLRLMETLLLRLQNSTKKTLIEKCLKNSVKVNNVFN